MGAITIKGAKTTIESNEKWYLHYFEKPPLGSKQTKKYIFLKSYFKIL
jgi:hypothetical protein